MSISATLESASTIIKFSVGAAIGALATFAVGTIYNVIWENPKITQEARADYVVLAEKAAADAKAARAERQLRDVQESLDALRARVAVEAAANRQKEEARELEIRDYEIRLDQAGRACRLDGADLDWLRKP